MDTKLKKSKYNPFLKATAIILTVVFAFLTGYQGLNAIRKALFFNCTDGNFYQTEAVQSSMRSILWDLQALKPYIGIYSDDLTFEEFRETDYAKEQIAIFDQQEERAIKLFRTIQELKKLKPENTEDVTVPQLQKWVIDANGNYFNTETGEVCTPDEYYNYYNNPDEEFNEFTDYSDNEEVTSFSVEYYPTEPNEISSIPITDEELFKLKESYANFDEWNNKYQLLRAHIFGLVDDATSEETISAEFDNKRYWRLDEIYNIEIYDVKESLNRYVNVEYLVIDNKTGAFVTNSEKSNADFIKDLTKGDLYFIRFDGNKLTSPPAIPNTSTNFSKFLYESGFFYTRPLDEQYIRDSFTGYSLYVKLNENVVQGDKFFNIVNAFNKVESNSLESYVTSAIAFAVISIAWFITACVFSGKRKDESIKLSATDKIPFIVNFLLHGALLVIAGAGVVIGVASDFSLDNIFSTGDANALLWIITDKTCIFFVGLCFAAFSLVLLNFVLYIVRNCKASTFSNRFITSFSVKKIKNAYKERQSLTESIKSLKRKTIIAISIWAAINVALSFCCLVGGEILIIPMGIFNVLCAVYIYLYISDVNRLMEIAEQIKFGNFDVKILPETYVKALRPFATNLRDCRDSIQTAVDEAIKGEHLKTELITNVSHDLKTPLTSIINYVSLLKMCEIEGEDEKKYIDILDEKSKKLKRLIEDLTEASKATSGNIKMNLSVVNLNELALQAVGENSDVLENAGLDLVLTERDTDIFVNADSQHTFRIIDNLFSNARKYSLPGTRVYVDVYKENNYGVLSIKNISKEKLNINPDELTERFVRGDNSRTTDGSGLGLSIAQSFAELQDGIFDISIDGDMFKATIKLLLNKEPKEIKSDTPKEAKTE